MDVIAHKKLPFGIIGIDSKGYISKINNRAVELLSIESDLVEGGLIVELIAEERLLKKIKSQLTAGFKDFTIRRVKWNKRYLQIRGQVHEEGLLILIIDDTEIVRIIDKGTRSLVVGQEAERSRLAKEIHDGIGPMISTIRLQIDALTKISEDDIVIEKLSAINEMIGEAARDLRQVSHDLMPSSLKDFGLVSSIEQMVRRLNEGGEMKVYFHQNLHNVNISKEIEINLYRVVQELINNAIKYAKANRLHIQIGLDGKEIALTVEDDGIGMDLNEVKSGMGMTNVQTRIKYLKGSFEIQSKEGEGVFVQINVPLK